MSAEIISGGKDAHICCFNLEGETNKIGSRSQLCDLWPSRLLIEAINLSCSRDGSIKVWDRVFSKVLQKIETKICGHKHSVNQMIILIMIVLLRAVMIILSKFSSLNETF